MSKHTETAGQYPVIPLRTEVQLPGHVGPLEIGREAGGPRTPGAQRQPIALRNPLQCRVTVHDANTPAASLPIKAGRIQHVAL